MSIVTVEVESVHGAANQERLIFYRGQDHLGQWHSYGPLRVNDPDFDIEGRFATVAAKLEETLAEREATEVIG